MDGSMPQALTEHNNHGEEIATMKTEISSIKGWMASMDAKIDNIANSLNSSRGTNWGLIWTAGGTVFTICIAGIVSLLAFNAAKIDPIVADIGRTNAGSQRIADAVLEQNKIISELRIQQAMHEIRDENIDTMIKTLNDKGSPGADKRLSALESRDSFDAFQERLDAIRYREEHKGSMP